MYKMLKDAGVKVTPQSAKIVYLLKDWKPVSLNMLVQELWPWDGPEDPKAMVHCYMSRLRKEGFKIDSIHAVGFCLREWPPLEPDFQI